MIKNNIQFLSGRLSSSERSEGRIEVRSRRTVLAMKSLFDYASAIAASPLRDCNAFSFEVQR